MTNGSLLQSMVLAADSRSMQFGLLIFRHRAHGRKSLHLVLAILHEIQEVRTLCLFAILRTRCRSRELTAWANIERVGCLFKKSRTRLQKMDLWKSFPYRCGLQLILTFSLTLRAHGQSEIGLFRPASLVNHFMVSNESNYC
jgi:hypothetical protein